MTRPARTTATIGRTLSVAALAAAAVVAAPAPSIAVPGNPATAGSSAQRAAAASSAKAKAHASASRAQRKRLARGHRLLLALDPYAGSTGEVVHTQSVWRNLSPGPDGKPAPVITTEGWFELGGGGREHTVTRTTDPVSGALRGGFDTWVDGRLTYVEDPGLGNSALVACVDPTEDRPDYVTPLAPAALAGLADGPLVRDQPTKASTISGARSVGGPTTTTRLYSATTGLLVRQTWSGATKLPVDAVLDIELSERLPTGQPAALLTRAVPADARALPGAGCLPTR